MNTYWNGCGKYQEDYNNLEKLIPGEGNCETLAGELMRAATRLSYDFYNNGMCNNTSGAVNFLHKNNVIDEETYNEIYPYSVGAIYLSDKRHADSDLKVGIENAMDKTIEYIKNNPEKVFVANTLDMLDFSDEEQSDYEYFDEDYYDTYIRIDDAEEENE